MAYLYCTRVWAFASATTRLRLPLHRACQLLRLSEARRLPSATFVDTSSLPTAHPVLQVEPGEALSDVPAGAYELVEASDDPVIQQLLQEETVELT